MFLRRMNIAGVVTVVVGITLAVGCSSRIFAQGSQSSQSSAAQQSSQQTQPAPSLENGPPPGNSQPQTQSQSGKQTVSVGQAPVSPQEAQAYAAVQKETNPDKQLQLVKDFQQKFPQSTLLSNVLFFGAGAAEEKNDVPEALNYGQESLKLQPDNLRSLILVAGLLPLPQALAGTPVQKQQQLGQSENDANRALQLLNNVQPPPNVAPAQFANGKKMIAAQLHASLGMAHLEKAVLSPSPKGPDANELSAAEQEFKTAVSSPQPNPQDYYRLGEVYARENKLDDAINAFTQAAHLGQGTAMEKLADHMVSQLQAQKAKSQQQANNPQPPPSNNQ
jgi:tetratricopeptide (TPR) repeat protein